MSLLAQYLAPLIALLPSLSEAGKIIVDSEVRKDNAQKLSTNVGKLGLGASGVLMIDPNTPPDVAIATLVLSLALYFYRRKVA